MEKKTYITPATLITALSVERMMALSTSEQSADPTLDMETKESSNWSNIWD